MDFGGYVSYTVGGFKCHAFGTPAVKDIINYAASELDMPQSLSLRPGRNGFRRTILKSNVGQVVAYSAFVGLSEPNVNRLGSFLAIGVATQQDIDCTANNLGHSLYNLLADLVERVSDGNRFTSELNIDVFNAFLRDNSPILEELHTGFVPSSRAIGSRTDQGVVFLSEERVSLTTVYNRICNYVPPATDFFLFETAASTELQNARHDFRVAAWPIRAAHADIRATPAVATQQPRPASSEVGSQTVGTGNQSDSERLRSLERLIEKSDERNHQRISSIEESLGLWKMIGMAAAGVLAFFLVLALFIFYSWNSTTNEQLAAIRQQLKNNQGYSRDGLPPIQERPPELNTPPIKAPVAPPTVQSPPSGEGARSSKSVSIPNLMNPSEIRSAYCPRYSKNNRTFESELKTLNSGSFDSKGTVRGGQTIILPIECSS